MTIHKKTRTRTKPKCCYLLLVVFVSICFFIPGAFAQAPADELPGLAELKKGDYETAIKLFSARLVTNPNDSDSEKHLLLAYREIGRYLEAETSAKKFLLKTPKASAVRHQLAEVFVTTGRYTEAISEFERAGADATMSSAEKLEADLRRAEVLQLTGQEDRARQIFESLIAYYENKQPESGAELKVVARALVHLEKFQDANDLYQAAIEADSSNLESKLGAGELFIQKYNYGDAAQFIEEALQLNPNSARAHLDVALVKRFEGGEEMSAALERAFRINPNLVEALTFRAGLALEASEYGEATADIEKAFKINPRSLDAHATRAAMLYLQDRDFEPEVAAALRINPRYGTIFNVLSHFATMTRRTAQAASFARRAIEISPRLWSAHLNLGMALLRLGQMEAGRAEVERAFQGDPFNVWAKNTLDLLDAMKDYRETKNGQFVIKADAKESDVISGYAAELLGEAATKLTAKYHFTPQGPIMVELFPNHDDFAVRTLGLPGLGALGVCFGQVIAADSPSARATGEFNWGSTLWHEYTHVITLQITDYRIPRWFSEGLSVYEERRARPGWGDDWNPKLLRAFGAGRWFKIADLDAGFQRPRGPEDLPIAYFQASQVCEFIVDRFGFDAILRMLALYRDKAQTADILRQVLKLSESEFDRAFKEYIETKTRPLQEALKTEFNLAASLSKADVLKMLSVQDTFALHLRAGHLLATGGDNQNAILHFKRAIELFPYYADEGNPYEPLAEILEKQGDKAQAADTLTALVKFDENNLVALRNVARLRLGLGDRTRALEAIRLSFYVSPFEYATHTQAGELSLDTKQYAQALAEFQITLALDPPNVAEANYNVANAYHMLGRPPEARRAVLRALEAAPSYEKAQELLLKITGQ
ncbi:MAG TPA: tetratricopeptide repeat protein [Pyrinomonadaceae bacterium]|nr:tetratricopeptide repeat protein [Pyrinomonadaceae bacterium]